MPPTVKGRDVLRSLMSDSTNPSEAGTLHKLDEMPAAYPHKEEKKNSLQSKNAGELILT